MNLDSSTPFFAVWRPRLSRGSLPRIDSPQPILHQLAALFSDRIPFHWLSPTDDGPWSRQRLWPFRLLFWTFLAQILSPGSSCRSAVRQAQAHAQLNHQPVPSADTSAYCQARSRLPLDLLRRLIERVAQTLEQCVPEEARWHGLHVKVLDGTTCTALDTPENQEAFPQPPTQKMGCGMPLIRLVALFSLASGALLDYACSTYLTSELAMASQLWTSLKPGDLILGDRLFGCYRVLAQLAALQCHGVFRLHATRKVDFRRGKRCANRDCILTWERPAKVPPGFEKKVWLAFPETIKVRVVQFKIAQKGFRSRQITLVTTLLDAQKYPAQELAALYARRWQIELSFRQIKVALSMDHLQVCSPAMIERSIAMHLLAYQLIRGLMQEASIIGYKPLERISFQGTMDACQHFSQAMSRSRSIRKRLELMKDLLRILATDRVPKRPGRSEPRAIKRTGKHYPKLTCPRRQFREIPHRHEVFARAKALRNSGA